MLKKKKIAYLFIPVFLLFLSATLFSDSRDKIHQPEKVMDLAGVEPGMVIGEVGAGEGYFTFKLSGRVGASGKIYANDIVGKVLRTLHLRCEKEGIHNIETIVGEVEDPLFPAALLDRVFIVNAFHDLTRPVALLDNLVPSLKAGARVVILDRDPARYNDRWGHFLEKEEVLERIGESQFELDRLATFLPEHNIYILKQRDR